MRLEEQLLPCPSSLPSGQLRRDFNGVSKPNCYDINCSSFISNQIEIWAEFDWYSVHVASRLIRDAICEMADEFSGIISQILNDF